MRWDDNARKIKIRAAFPARTKDMPSEPLSLLDINAAADVRKWHLKPTTIQAGPPAGEHRTPADVRAEVMELDTATAAAKAKKTSVEANLLNLREKYAEASLMAGVDDSNVKQRDQLRRQIEDAEARLKELDVAIEYAAEQRKMKKVEGAEVAMQAAFDAALVDLDAAACVAAELQQHLIAVGDLFKKLKAHTDDAFAKPAHHLASRTKGLSSPLSRPDVERALLIQLAAVGGPRLDKLAPSEIKDPVPLVRLVDGYRSQLHQLRTGYAGKPLLSTL